VAGVQQELNNNIQGAVLTAANQLTLSLAATGEEVSLEGLISNLLSQSVAGVQQELNNNIQGAVLTAANQFNLVEEATYATKTSITDLHSDVTATATANATAAAE
jgi:hypothetical protein